MTVTEATCKDIPSVEGEAMAAKVIQDNANRWYRRAFAFMGRKTVDAASWSMERYITAPSWMQWTIICGLIVVALALLIAIMTLIELGIQLVTIWLLAVSPVLAYVFYILAEAVSIFGTAAAVYFGSNALLEKLS